MSVSKRYFKRLAPVVTAVALIIGFTTPAQAAVLTSVSVSPSTGAAAATAVSYTITASNVTNATPIKCIRVEFDSSADGTGGKPSGMVLTGTTLNSSSNYIPTPANFTPTVDNTNGIDTFVYAAGTGTPASASNRTIIIDGITNPATGSYYALINTYTAADCSTGPVDSAVAVFVTTTSQTVSVQVDPSFTLAVNGESSGSACGGSWVTPTVTTTSSTVPFGRVAVGGSAIGCQQLRVNSNASGGYMVYAKTGSALTSGSDTIADFSGTTAAGATLPQTSTAAFGWNTSDYSDLSYGTMNGSTLYAGGLTAATAPGTAVAKGNSGATYTNDDTYIGFKVYISGATKAGNYQSTLTYTAVPTF